MNRSRAIAFALAAVVSALPAATAHAGFHEVVSAIEARGGHQSGVAPLFGLVRMAVWIAHPSGVHDLQLAIWEDKSFDLNGRDIEPLLRAKAGDYRPIVAARSRNGEWSFIYARPHGNLVDMLVVAHDTSDTVVVRTVVEPERLAREISKHRRGNEKVDVAWR